MISVSPEELLAVVRERFPLEYEIAGLELTVRVQARRIAELEQTIAAAGRPESGSDEPTRTR